MTSSRSSVGGCGRGAGSRGRGRRQLALRLAQLRARARLHLHPAGPNHPPPHTPPRPRAPADLGASPGGATGRHWVLDPIDGTRGFVGMRQYAVCLGMLQDGDVALGVLGCPNLPQDTVRDDDGGEGARPMRVRARASVHGRG